MLHATAHWKAIILHYLHSESQVHRIFFASAVACPKQENNKKPFYPLQVLT
jgi:hypothetical protein